MTDEKSKERFVVEISSSDESKSSPWQSDDDAAEDISSSTSCNDDDDDDEDRSEWSYSDEDKAEVGRDEESDIDDFCKPDAESMCNKVVQLIQERSDLQELKVDEYKAYLRRHRLRLSGSKEECIERIKEHWKLKDGNGEIFYPRSSFTIDCTGDVCKGDIVLFHQKIHQTSGKTARNRTVGRRTVAGRIIKESYGATRQQHTFTVEVLWNRGANKLEPLFPLLVKGRNLYKLKTFRQLWKNEKERVEVLAEKHSRGNAARTIRAMRRNKGVMRKNESLALKGQRCNRFHHVSPSRTRETSPREKTCLNERGKLDRNKKRIHSHRSAPVSSKRRAGSRGSAHNSRRHNSPDQVRYNHSVAPFRTKRNADSRGSAHHNYSPIQVRQSPSLSCRHRVAPFCCKQNAGSRGSAHHSRHHNSPNQVRQFPSSSYNHRFATGSSNQNAGSRGSAYLNSPDEVRQSLSPSYNHCATPFRSNQDAGSRGSAEPHRRRHNSPDQVRLTPSSSYNYPAQTFHHFKSDVFPIEPHNIHSHGGFASGAEFSYPSSRPTSRWQETSHESCSNQSLRSTTERHRWR